MVIHEVTGDTAEGTVRQGTTPQRSSRAWARWRKGGGIWAIVLILPLVVSFTYFNWGPIINGVVVAFQRTNLLTYEWVGWSNFEYVLSSPTLPIAIRNTVVFAVLSILLSFPLPVALAVFISEMRTAKGFHAGLAYLPVVIPPVVAILLWKQFYDPEPTGPLNSILGLVGLGPFEWLNSKTQVIPAMVIEATWAGFGGGVVLYIAALAGVRNELYEAAELDGAGIWRRVWHITLPQIRNVILVMFLLHLIGVMQVFNEPLLFAGGGPDRASTTIMLMIYSYGFEQFNFGAAAALSVMLAGVLAILSVVYYFVTRRWSADV